MYAIRSYYDTCDTDVITSVTVSSGANVTTDNPATVDFYINGNVYRVTDIVLPAGVITSYSIHYTKLYDHP